MNSGNLVSRIGLARRNMWVAIWIGGIMSVVAILGWSRSVNVIAERPIGSRWPDNGCTEYISEMCVN